MRRMFVFIVLLVSLPLFSQSSASQNIAATQNADRALAADAPTREQVAKLLDLINVRRNMEIMLNGMKEAAKSGAEQMLRRKVSDPTPAQLEAVKGIYNDVFGSMPIDEMFDAAIPIYQRHLTKNDVEAITAFYASPTGQKLLREQPEMIKEGMRAGVEIEQRRMDDLMQKVDRRIAEMLEKNPESGKKP